MIFYDIAAMALIGIGHLYLFSLLIDYKKFSLGYVLVIGVLLTFFVGISITLTGLVELNVVLLSLFLVLIGLMNKKLKPLTVIYFALCSMVLFTVIKNGLFSLVRGLYIESPFNYYSWTDSALHFWTLVVLVLAMYIARKKIEQIGRYMVASRWYIPSFILAIVCTLLLLVINYPTISLLAQINALYSKQIYSIILLLSVLLMLIVTISVYMSKERLIEEHEMMLQSQLIDYVNKLELMHDDLATFRHDYMNLLLSLEEGIRTKNIEQIEQIYDNTIAPTTAIINDQQLELVKLSRVKIPEIKSVLSVKIVTAQHKQLQVSVDIPHDIRHVYIPTNDFIRMISILIDNATEEASKSTNKLIQIALFETDPETQYCVVKNSTDAEALDLQSMYNKSYSTKGEQRGYGLFSIKRLLGQHANMTLSTSLESQMFTQTVLLKMDRS